MTILTGVQLCSKLFWVTVIGPGQSLVMMALGQVNGSGTANPPTVDLPTPNCCKNCLSACGIQVPSDIASLSLLCKSGWKEKVGGVVALFISSVHMLLFQSANIVSMGKSLSLVPNGNSKSNALKCMHHMTNIVTSETRVPQTGENA